MTIMCITALQAQQKYTGITRYDLATYQGIPISKGWLMSDSLYRVVYHYANSADSLMSSFAMFEKAVSELQSSLYQIKREYELRSQADSNLIASQAKTITDLNTLISSSTNDNRKIMKQFWTIGKAEIKIHKPTTFTVGISVGLLAYMVGKSF